VKLLRDTAGMPRWRKPFSLPKSEASQSPVAHFSTDLKMMTLKGFVVGVLTGPSEVCLVPSANNTLSYDSQIRMVTWYMWINSWLFRIIELLFKIPGSGMTLRYIARRDPKELGFYFELLADVMTTSSAKRSSSLPSSAVGVMVDTDFSQREMPVVTLFLVKDFKVEPPWTSLMVTCETYSKAKEGDLICMLLGANVPFLIRKISNRHILVGPATFGGFVQDGLIWNKILQQYTDRRAKLKSFTLS